MPAPRRKKLQDAISQEMVERGFEPTKNNKEPTKDNKEPTKDNMIAFRVRIPPADLSLLKAVSKQEGTTVGALIRRAIKELIRRQGAGLR